MIHAENIFQTAEASGAVLATAIHAGHAMRDALGQRTQLTSSQRLREEDPFTDIFASGVSSRIVATQSRFQVDLNRPRERAVYQAPEDAWGLTIWKEPLPPGEIDDSLQEYDAFYATLQALLDRKLETHSHVVVLDIHSYNHRRGGQWAPFDDPMQNPEVNIGTGTLASREKWEHVIEPLLDTLKNSVIMGRHLDVRENVKFEGGEMARWIHARYPERVCCVSLEFKKIFMNEWSGEGDTRAIEEIRGAIEALEANLETILQF